MAEAVVARLPIFDVPSAHCQLHQIVAHDFVTSTVPVHVSVFDGGVIAFRCVFVFYVKVAYVPAVAVRAFVQRKLLAMMPVSSGVGLVSDSYFGRFLLPHRSF